MLQVYAKPFVTASDLLAQLMLAGNDKNVRNFHPETIIYITNQLTRLREQLEAMGMNMTALSVNRLNDQLERSGVSPSALRSGIEEIRSRMWDEIDSAVLLHLSSEKASYFSSPEAAWSREFLSAVPSAEFDLDEGLKCFALGRYTACVFHLMRATEAIASMMANKLGASVAAKSREGLTLGVVLANIGGKIEEMPKGREKGDWLRAKALLHSVNRGFRTPTAHPKQTYTEEEADAVINALKGFIPDFVKLL